MTRQDEEEIMALVADLIDKKIAIAIERLKKDIPKAPPAPPKKYVNK